MDTAIEEVGMSKKYKPIWFVSPFQHLKYTLIREEKNCKKIDIDFGLIALPQGSNATTNFICNEDDTNLRIVVYMPYADVSLLSQQGLVIHESVHIWQEIKKMMRESEPSIEFEAYSIQRIAQDLLHLLELSNELEKPDN